ncbi:MAG: IgGFc-binding protein, partial [Myxococcales bacterium]|nr:IgGFc-binding protein [Myxococcales bacterium]
FCAPGAQRCAENAYQQCADDGSAWVELASCVDSGEVCVTGVGCRPCYPDLRTCDGLDILRCRPDGTGTDVIATCADDPTAVCFAGDCVNACALAADARSYEGCEYWAVDLDNAVVSTFGAASAQQFSVVLSNPGILTAEVTVELQCDAEDAANPAYGCTDGAPYVVAGPFEVGPGDLRVVDLDAREVDGSTSPELNDGPGTFVSRRAYRVHSTAPIIAYQFNPLENVGVFSNDASLLLPREALDDRYLVLSWPQTLALTDDALTNGGIDLRAFLTVVATEDDTIVQVDLATDILGGGGVDAASAGDTIEVHLDRFGVLNLETDGFDADFTGSRVRGSHPVAVFTGSEASDVPRFDTLSERSCCADHLEEQLFPEIALGFHFVAVKSPLRGQAIRDAGWDVPVVPDEPEYWRILAAGEDTLVKTDLPPPNDTFLLQRGQSVIFASERDFVIDANKPIAVGQFPVSQQATGIPSTLSGGLRPPGGDPSMIVVPPVEQWRSSYLFLVPNKYAFDSLLIAAPATAELRFDHIPLQNVLTCEYEPMGTLPTGPGDADVEYVAIRCPLSWAGPDGDGNQDDGVHLLESVGGEPVGLIVWGWDSFVSYGYPGGTNVSPINLD